jgi:tartrate-resistant acid phosphatase type 5
VTAIVRSSLASVTLAATFYIHPANAQTNFAIVGDTGNSSAATAVADLIKDRSPDHIVTTGDNCYGKVALSTQVGSRYGSYVDFRRFWPSLGNHEYEDVCGDKIRAYKAYFDLPNNERYYEVRLGPVHFFIVNSNNQEPDGRSATSKQANWIKSRVQASSAPWQVVVFHHPPFSSGSSGSTTIMRWPFEQWGVDAVFNGHAHDYERILRDDDKDGKKIAYFVSGLGGASKGSFSGTVQGSVFKYNAEFGALFLTATDSQLSFEFRNVKGNVVDTYTLSK